MSTVFELSVGHTFRFVEIPPRLDKNLRIVLDVIAFSDRRAVYVSPGFNDEVCVELVFYRYCNYYPVEIVE